MKTNQLQKNIPNGWQNKKIFEICEVVPGGTPSTTIQEYWNGDLVWITPNDLSKQESKYITDSERKITEKGLKSSSANKIPRNSVVLSSRAPIGYLSINKVDIATNQGCKSFVCGSSISNEYLYYYLDHNMNDVKKLGAGSTFAEVGKQSLEGIEIIFPPKPEQEKIAEILSKVDEDIEKTEQIIEKNKKLKSGLTRELLTNKIKNKDWETVQIKKAPLEMIDGDRGVNYPKLTDFSNDDYCLFLTNKNVKNDSFDFSESQFISKDNDNKLRKGKLNRYDCILTTRGTVGTVAFYDKNVVYENIRINSGMLIFRAKSGFDPRFLYQLLKSESLKKRYKEMASGSAQPQLPIRSLENIIICYPKSIDEQKEIAEILSSVDEKISVNKKLKEKLTKLKKGLMSDLLGGNVITV